MMSTLYKKFISTLLIILALLATNHSTATTIPIKNNFEITVTEDLMREHGLLSRILLIYEKELQLIAAGKPPNYQVISQAATIVKNFIENYHEKLEENYLFPRFEKTKKLTNLVKILREQHQAGRHLTNNILIITQKTQAITPSELDTLTRSLKAFINMYRPHKAREDTVLFPALHEIISLQEYEDLGDKFEDIEHKLFGKKGFADIEQKISQLEKLIGIYQLGQFTAK